jgi:hypothetical protein
VNDSRNDFANWIKACIKHESLANTLMSARQKQQFIDILATEVELLKNPVLDETAKFFQEDMGEAKVAVPENKPITNNAVESVSSSQSVPSQISDSKSVSEQLSATSAKTQIPIGFPNPEKITAAEILDFEQFLEPLIKEFENEIIE